jgi:DNA-directed RNA polymerase subunit M/transcription elongation factor TFIIS
MAGTVRFCPNCKLVVKPDERIYRDANEFCPRCGHKYTPNSEDEENEQSD